MHTLQVCLFAHRGKKKRDASILVHQVVTSQRALQHAAWGARKELMSKLRTMKEEDLVEGPNRQSIADLKAGTLTALVPKVYPLCTDLYLDLATPTPFCPDLHKKYQRLLQQQQSLPRPPTMRRQRFQRRVEVFRAPSTGVPRSPHTKHSTSENSVRFTCRSLSWQRPPL